MTVLIGTSEGAYDRGRVRVRSSGGVAATSAAIYIDRSSRGRGEGEIDLNDGDYITVLNMRLIWAIPPYISQTGVTYKYGLIPFNSTSYLPPIPNAGPDRLVVVRNSGDTATITFNARYPSAQTHPDATSSLTYSWLFPDGQTSTSANPTMTFTAPMVGYARKTVTDSLGNQSAGYCLVAVVHEGHQDLLSGWEITSHTQTAEGSELSLKISQTLDHRLYPPGTEILIRRREYYDDNFSSISGVDFSNSSAEGMIFCGYLDSEENYLEASDEGPIAKTAITCVDTAGRLKKLPGFPQIVEREASPARWENMKGLNADRYAFYILHWHSNVLSRATLGLSGTGETYAAVALSSDGQSLYEQADMIAQAIAHKLTCNKLGELGIVRDPQLTSTRTSTVILTLDSSDYTSYRFTNTKAPRVHWNWGEGVVTSTASASSVQNVGAVFCVAPGFTPGQGVSSSTTGKQLVTGQNELNEREGHRYAARMNQIQGNLELDLVRSMDIGIDPALMEWVRIGVSGDERAPRLYEWDNTTRFLPIEISWEYHFDGGYRVPKLTLEREVFGVPAQSYFPPAQEDNPFIDSTLPLPTQIFSVNVPPQPIPIWSGTDQIPVLIYQACSASNRIVRTTGIGGTLTHTEIHSAAVTGQCRWMASDPFNYKRLFVLTTDGLFKTDNKTVASPTWTQVANNAAIFGASGRYGNEIMMSHNKKGWIAAMSGENVFAYSFNYGATWNRVSIDGAAQLFDTNPNYVLPNAPRYSLAGHNSAAAGHIYAIRAWLDSGTYKVTLFRSTDYGQTWSAAYALYSSGTNHFSISGSVHVPYKRNATTKNTNGSGFIVYVAGWDGANFMGRLKQTTSFAVDATWAALPSPWKPPTGRFVTASAGLCSSNRSITSFTHDGTKIALVTGTATLGMGDISLFLSTDSGATWTQKLIPTSILSDTQGPVVGINGFSMHSKFWLVFKGAANKWGADFDYNYRYDLGPVGSQRRYGSAYTPDDGATWYDCTPPTFEDRKVVYAEGDLSQYQ
jgi:hypothetical protein